MSAEEIQGSMGLREELVSMSKDRLVQYPVFIFKENMQHVAQNVKMYTAKKKTFIKELWEQKNSRAGGNRTTFTHVT